MKHFIHGIQQIGIGVKDADQAKLIYKNDFGMNVKVFDDTDNAVLMTQFTGNEEHRRRAILSLNMAGGGGFEIWQFLSREPTLPHQQMMPGDLGIFAARIKSRDIAASYRHFQSAGNPTLSPIYQSPDHRKHFWVCDPYNNRFQFVESSQWFRKQNYHCGGVSGAVIGVSNMENALHFYADLLGIDQEIYNLTGEINDFPPRQDGGKRFKRVLLRKNTSSKGAFSQLLGEIEIELVQVLDQTPSHIYHERFWGDCGFIHLCFDVPGMDSLKDKCLRAGYPFRVDSSSSFAMEQASGRFSYVEDPDGTLIEFVETHKVPILKKLNLYLDLKKRKNNRPLPAWMIACMAVSKIK